MAKEDENSTFKKKGHMTYSDKSQVSNLLPTDWLDWVWIVQSLSQPILRKQSVKILL